MFNFLLRRLIVTIPLLILISIIAFALVYVLPGDVTLTILGPEASRELRQELRAELGLDQPMIVQYWQWISSFVRGDFGQSHVNGSEISSLLKQRLPVTLELLGLTMLTSIILGLGLGIVSALKSGKVLDFVISIFSLLGLSVPGFWVGMLLILLVMRTGLALPISGFVPVSAGLKANLMALVLPVVTASVRELGLLARFTKTGVLEVISHDYVRTAYAKGLKRTAVIGRHVLRNALIPIITVAGLQIASMLSGLVIIETVFVLPGFGRLILDSILSRDTEVLLTCIMLIATAVVIINLLIDFLYAVVDPRIRYERAS